MPVGIFQRNVNDIKYISVTKANNYVTLTFEYRGKVYSLNIQEDLKALFTYYTTDIRNGETAEIWKADDLSSYTFVKQFWSNDVGEENFWWVDSTHVLALSKSNMTLFKKSNQFHDWMGDVWIVEAQALRSDWLTDDDKYWAVSSAYKAEPAFFKIQPGEGVITVKYIRDITNPGHWGNPSVAPSWETCEIPVEYIELKSGTGVPLSTTGISAFVPIDPTGLVSAAEITATVRGTKFLLGIKLGRGLTQWTVTVADSPTVFNGYGSVGVMGELTGGQIPALFMNSSDGFIGEVYPLSDFKDVKGLKVNSNNKDSANLLDSRDDLFDKIYCDGQSLWFVYNELPSIVSHLSFINNNHRMETIPLKQNYSYKFEQSAASIINMSSFLPSSMGPLDVLFAADTQGLSKYLSMATAIAIPSFWHMKPLFNYVVYVLQGMIQSSHVWRNKLDAKSEDGKSDRELVVAASEQHCSMQLSMHYFSNLR